MKALDLGAMRRINADITLKTLLGESTGLPVAELRYRTGLSRTTVESILAELKDQGWVRGLSAANTTPAGRPPRSFEVVSDRVLLGVVSITQTRAEAVVVDLRGMPCGRAARRLADQSDPVATLEEAYSALNAALAASEYPDKPLRAAVVATAGAVDDDGVVRHMLADPRWDGFDIAGYLGRRAGFTVFAENDVKLAASAERSVGCAQSYSDFLWLTVGSRAGMGLVIDGKLHRGSEGAAGEFILSDAFSGVRQHDNQFRWINSTDKTERAKALQLADAARVGDLAAVKQLEQFCEPLSALVMTLIWTLAPKLIVLGGGLEGIADLLLPRLRESVDARRCAAVEFAASTLGSDGTIVGATNYLLARLGGSLIET